LPAAKKPEAASESATPTETTPPAPPAEELDLAEDDFDPELSLVGRVAATDNIAAVLVDGQWYNIAAGTLVHTGALGFESSPFPLLEDAIEFSGSPDGHPFLRPYAFDTLSIDGVRFVA